MKIKKKSFEFLKMSVTTKITISLSRFSLEIKEKSVNLSDYHLNQI